MEQVQKAVPLTLLAQPAMAGGHVTRVTSTFLGQMQTSSTCPQCGGEGQIITDKMQHLFRKWIVKGEEIISLNIPAGVAEGMQLSVSGKGNAAARGGINGDLIVVTKNTNILN